MSSYHTSFTYLNKNSYDDYNLQIIHFESGDSGETESYLSQDAVYHDSVRGTRRTMYGSKYNSVAVLNITVMRPNGEEFSIERTREINKWLTGAAQYSWMDLYVGDEIKYRMHCFVQDVRPYKIDSRVVGFIITAESSSPWCYSTLQTITQAITGNETLQINNPSDDMYTYTELRTVFKNSTGKSLVVKNNTLCETTTINNLAANEVITLSENMFITSDKTTRIFGNDFNYVWPKLKAGVNNLTVNGTGTITFEYIYPMKVVDCVGDLNAASDPVCDENGQIILDQLPWSRISDTPNTLGGYGIDNAYTKTEVDKKIANIQIDAYTKSEINAMLENFVSDDVYTKTEVDNKIDSLNSDITTELNKVKRDLSSNYYTTTEIDDMLEGVQVDDSGNLIVSSVPWGNISGKPTTLAGYEIETEVDEKIAAAISGVQTEIDEEELNAMLAEVLGE